MFMSDSLGAIRKPFGVRFAPSPTGPFHIGNLRTAWIARKLAIHLEHPLIIRFENIDKPRNIEGAAEKQTEDMLLLGIEADITQFQSDFHRRHYQLFKAAVERDAVYPCVCSRSEIQEQLRQLASAPHHKPAHYTGHCRNLKATDLDSKKLQKKDLGWRLRSQDQTGYQDFLVARSPFPLKEIDFSPSYNWACAIDDHDGNFALLVRAWDLDHVIEQQRLIHDLIDQIENTSRAKPKIFHSSLVILDDGHRLEKRTQGTQLTELLGNGWTSAKILTSFEKSLNQKRFNELSSFDISGEPLREIKLSQILGD